jgi:hypothetical protein
MRRLLALAFVWLSACTANIPEGIFACNSVSQCPDNWVCRDDGFCAKFSNTQDAACNSPGDCPRAYVCGADGHCQEALDAPGTTNCNSAFDCPNSWLCTKERVCSPAPSGKDTSPCDSPRACPFGWICSGAGFCQETSVTEGSMTCSSALECPSGWVCRKTDHTCWQTFENGGTANAGPPRPAADGGVTSIPGATVLIPTSGGGQSISPGYSLWLDIGAPQPSGSASSANYQMRLGVPSR